MKESKKGKTQKEKKVESDKEICEIFEVEKNGEKEIIESCGTEEKKPTTKEQIQEENKTLRNILIGISLFIIMLFAIYFFIDSIRHFEYKGIEFEVVKEEKLILYKTSLPVTYQGKLTEYNFYLRNDPRELENIPFEGEILLAKNAVINVTNDIKCDGDEVIALANLLNLYNVLGVNYMKDENASCDFQGRYIYLNIKESNETNVEQFGQTCYNININNCEILKGLEKFMVETFAEVNKKLNE